MTARMITKKAKDPEKSLRIDKAARTLMKMTMMTSMMKKMRIPITVHNTVKSYPLDRTNNTMLANKFHPVSKTNKAITPSNLSSILLTQLIPPKIGQGQL